MLGADADSRVNLYGTFGYGFFTVDRSGRAGCLEAHVVRRNLHRERIRISYAIGRTDRDAGPVTLTAGYRTQTVKTRNYGWRYQRRKCAVAVHHHRSEGHHARIHPRIALHLRSATASTKSVLMSGQYYKSSETRRTGNRDVRMATGS